MHHCPHRVAVIFLAAFGSALCLSAQAPTYTPFQAETESGNSANWFPLGQPSATYQQVHSASSFSAPGPLQLNSISFRPRSTQSLGSIDIRVAIAASPHDSNNASSTFANNEIPGTRIVVFDRKTVALPAPDGTWTLTMPFDRPFQWTGGHLSWTIDIYSNSTGAPLFYSSFGFTGVGPRTEISSGCTATGSSSVASLSTLTGFPGGVMTSQAFSQLNTAGTPALVLYGIRPFNPTVDLGLIGAPTCNLAVRIAAAVPASTDSAGRATVTVPIPNTPGFVGAALFTQAAFIEPTANALGIFTSNSQRGEISPDYGVTRIFNGQGVPIGGIGIGTGLAVRFN